MAHFTVHDTFHCLCSEKSGGNNKLNESGRQKQGGQKSSQQVQHAKLYSDLLQLRKREPLIAVASPPGGTFISAPTVPNRGLAGR